MLNLFPPLHIVEFSVTMKIRRVLFMFEKKLEFQYEKLVNEGANPKTKTFLKILLRFANRNVQEI